jgi:hypothetical protein
VSGHVDIYPFRIKKIKTKNKEVYQILKIKIESTFYQ